ncbi:MAG: SDR family NAD(P)-dependent oxidoreductase [Anaerolineae bacterium]|nr:SDR family NAD(P)-dependent oxidoreductase [Thermoflexales bacterium]MDW8408935.1 SDR family NAD(P)-dependent oxidoreductase [Anaerolineae bacterium]
MTYSVKDKIVFITGASSGIGEACARAFAAAGARLILCARRVDRLDRLAAALNVPTHCFALDVRDQAAVQAAIAGLPAEWQAIDILVNNAGLSRGLTKLHEYDLQDVDEMVDTNVKGLVYVTRAVVPGMVARQRGHVINIGSIAGHAVYPNGAVYCATKAAVKSITEGLKMDLLGTPVRVTSVDPGLVETEFSIVRFHGDVERAKKVYEGLRPLSANDVADVVLFCATRPPHVNINDVVLMPVAQASATLVHRQPLPGIE